MKLSEYFNIGSMLTSIGAAIKGMANPAFLLLSSSTVGFIQVFVYRKELTIDLAVGVGVCFLIMTILGLVKHIKDGEAKAEIFLRKTVEQLVVMVAVICLGYMASLVISVVFRMFVGDAQKLTAVPTAAMYFTFAGYGIMFTYYFIKCCDLVDHIKPGLLKPWFSAAFRKYRDSGDYKDLIAIVGKKEVGEEEEVQ